MTKKLLGILCSLFCIGVMVAPGAMAVDEECVPWTSLSGLPEATRTAFGIDRSTCVPRSTGEAVNDALYRWATNGPDKIQLNVISPSFNRIVPVAEATGTAAVATIALGTKVIDLGNAAFPAIGAAAAGAYAWTALHAGSWMPWTWNSPVIASLPTPPGTFTVGAGPGTTGPPTAVNYTTTPTFNGANYVTTMTGVTRTYPTDPTGAYGAFATGSGGMYWEAPGATFTAAEFNSMWQNYHAGTCVGFLACFGNSFAGSVGAMTAAFNTGTKVMTFSPVAAALKMQTVAMGGGATGVGWQPRFYHGNFGTTDFVVDLQTATATPTTTRTLIETLHCKASGGGTYDVTGSTVITPGSAIHVPKVNCAAGDRVLDGKADLKTDNSAGTRTDPVIKPSPGNDLGTDPGTGPTSHGKPSPWIPVLNALPTLPSSGTVQNTAPSPKAPGAPEVTFTPGDVPSISPASPSAAVGEDFCGFGWTDILNPLEAAFKGMSCALKWAFVPEEGFLQEQVQASAEEWTASPPGTLMTAVMNVPSGLIDEFTGVTGDCHGPLVPARFAHYVGHAGMTTNVHPLDSCADPVAIWRVWTHRIMVFILVLSGASAIANIILSALGMRQLPDPTEDAGEAVRNYDNPKW